MIPYVGLQSIITTEADFIPNEGQYHISFPEKHLFSKKTSEI